MAVALLRSRIDERQAKMDLSIPDRLRQINVTGDEPNSPAYARRRASTRCGA